MLDAERGSCDEYFACLFILVADGGRYQGLKRALDNQYLMDKDAYPETLPQALKLLEQFKPELFADAVTGKPAGNSRVTFPLTKAIRQHVLNVVQRDTQLTTALSLMLQGRKNSGLTEKQLKKQSRALLMLLLPTPLLLPQRLHPLRV